ncbi:MAG: AgmX/PglI C-terminal domain-containing protein, partial [Sandaracinaceae bacterium]|nr:AgmX/PglI C-terminal domain-containing protein [Sandaracinaceae bacterium]
APDDAPRIVALVGLADDGRPLYSGWVALGPLVLEPFRQGCPPRTTAPFSRNDPLCEGECVRGTTRASSEGALPAAHWRCQISFGRLDIQRVSIEQGRLRWRVALDASFEQSTECECTPNVEPRPECPEGRARGLNGTEDAYCERSGAGTLLVVREQEGRPQWEALLERPMGIMLTSCECAPAGEAPPRQPPVPCSDPCPASRPDAGAVPPPLENPLGLELPGNPFGAAPRAPRRSPEVALGGASVVGALDREVVQRVVRSHLEEVRLCYEQGLDRDANLAGVVEVSFVVDPTGTVPSAAVRRTTIDDPSVGECIRRAVLRWRFPHPRGGSVTINYPFVLRATEP